MDSRTCGSRECQRRLKFWIRLSFRFDKVTNIDFQLLIDDFRFDPTACFEVIDTTDTRSTFVQPGVDGIPAPTESPLRDASVSTAVLLRHLCLKLPPLKTRQSLRR
jgi:hypothetical protein